MKVLGERGKRSTVTVLRKGIIAHENKIARFETNMQHCHGILGSIEPLTAEEFRNETLSSWLWENNF